MSLRCVAPKSLAADWRSQQHRPAWQGAGRAI